MTETQQFDVIVIGGGPAGQKAAIQGAKVGAEILVVDRARAVGGACVRYGTIPSKTLRETALALTRFRRLTEHVVRVDIPDDLQIASLMSRKDAVIAAHERYMQAQLTRNNVSVWQGAARFVTPTEVEVTAPGGARRVARARAVIITTGSTPRTPDNVPIDHENILDSDSILAMSYLPKSLTVLGSGVIACEYASIFAALGVNVTLIDQAARPLAFLDAEIVAHFVSQFEEGGNRYLGNRKLGRVAWDGFAAVDCELSTGEVVQSEKLFCALGRLACVDGLDADTVGVKLSSRRFIEVDEFGRTSVPTIYAAGDVIGPPALASTSMEQGRRAMCHALNLDLGSARDSAPLGIYTIPEMAGVGLSEEQAVREFGAARVGRASFAELARGQISGADRGMLKLVVHADSGQVLGAQAVGESASDLVHIAQFAILGGLAYEVFVDAVFNFPTFAEAYRVAALDLHAQQARYRRSA